jgi:hypothetical protein
MSGQILFRMMFRPTVQISEMKEKRNFEKWIEKEDENEKKK